MRLAGRIKDNPNAFSFRYSDSQNSEHIRVDNLISSTGPATEFIREISNKLALLASNWETIDSVISSINPDGVRRICDACDQALQFYEELPSKAQIVAQTCNLQKLKESLSKVTLPKQ